MELLRRISTGRFTRSGQAQKVALVSKIFGDDNEQQKQGSSYDSDIEAIEVLGKIFQGELQHLKLASPTIESSTQKLDAHPNTAVGSHSPSFKLYETEYAEINRTMMSALALKWLMHGDYEKFTAGQAKEKQLSRKTFNELRDYFKTWLRTPDDIYDLVVALVTSDLGKDPDVFEQLKKRQLIASDEANHDVVVYIAAQHDEFPTLAALPKERREDIIHGIKFAASVNIPQLVQGECVPGNLKEARILKSRPRALALKCMEILLDVAGASGDRDVRGAITMTESVVGAYKTAFAALSELQQEHSTMRECYDAVIQYRRKLLEGKKVVFSFSSPAEERACLRLLCMGRVDNEDMGKIFVKAFNTLVEPSRQLLIDGLNVDGVDDGTAILPYYMPGLFVQGLRMSKSKEGMQNQALTNVLQSLFRFLSRILGGTRPCPGQEGQILERNVAFAKKVIGSDKFLTEPGVLDELEIPYPPVILEDPNGETNQVTRNT